MAPSHSGHDTFNLFLVSDSNEPQPPARRASEKQVRSLTVATNNLALSTPATSPSTTESLAQSVLKFDVHPNANVIVNASNNAHGNANVNTNTDTYNNGGNTKGKKRYGSMSEDLHQLIEGHVSESDDTSPPPQPPPPSMMRKKPAIKLSRDKLCRVPLATLPTTTSTAATMTRPHSFLIAPSASEYCFPLIPRRYSTTSVTVTGSNGSLGGGGGGQSSGAVVAHPSSISQSPSPRPPISLQRTHSSDSFRALSETPMHTQYQQHLFKATHSSNSVMQQQQGPFDQQQSQWQQLQNATLFDSQGLLLAMRNPGGIGNAETLPPQQLHPSQPPAQAFLSNSSNPTSHSFMRPPHPLQQQPQQQHGPLPFVQLPTSSGYHAHTQQLALTTGLTRFPEQPNLIAPGLDFHLDLDLDLDFADPYLSVLDLNHRSQQGDGTGPISSSSTVGQQTIVEQNQEQYDITALIPPSSSSSSATTTATTTTTTTTITTSSTTAIPIQNIQNTQNTPHPNRIRVDSEADGGSMSKKTVLERNMEYIEPSSAVLQEHYQQKRRFSVEYLSQVSNSSNSSSSNGSSSSSSTRQAQRQEVQYQAQNQEVPHDMEQDGMASSSKSFGNEEAKSDDLAGDDGVEKDDGNVEGDEDSQRVDEEEDEEEKEEEEKDEEEMVNGGRSSCQGKRVGVRGYPEYIRDHNRINNNNNTADIDTLRVPAL
ncbi:hypothetical protein BGZ94_002449 [Podila epigama]|nr:hypothetical protein BGZ94_002449 [Podila epigama]